MGSRLIKGTGPVYAKRLVEAFGEAVFDVIEQEPGAAGLGPRDRDLSEARLRRPTVQ